MKKVVWEVEIKQKFKGGIVEFYTEYHAEDRDLYWALQKMRKSWFEEVLNRDDHDYCCTDVKVLSVKKICELT